VTKVDPRWYDGIFQAEWPGGSRSALESSIRAYAPAELRTLLRRAGLDVERVWGSFDRTDLGDGGRTVLLARKS
jgi:hypothetical protein